MFFEKCEAKLLFKYSRIFKHNHIFSNCQMYFREYKIEKEKQRLKKMNKKI